MPSLAAADEAMTAAAVTTFVAVQAGDGPRSQRAATALQRTASRLLLSPTQPAAHTHKGGLRLNALHRVESLIEKWLNEQGHSPDIGELAAKAQLSVNHFIRAFRQTTGTTPYQYLMVRRQQRAMALLGEPGLSVADVADLLGFSSSAHFGALFRQKSGVPPGAYRDAVLGPNFPSRSLLRYNN